MTRSVVSFLLLLAAAVFGVTLLLPKMRQVRALTLEKNALVSLAETRAQQKRNLDSLQATFISRRAEISQILATLPDSSNLPELLVTIEAMGKESGATFESLVPNTEARDHVMLNLTGRASLASYEALMNAVAANHRPMSVESYSLSAGSDVNSLTFSVALAVPFRAAIDAAPPTEAAP